MLSPETLAALYRLVAILLALVDALAAPVAGVRRPLVTRLATGALSISLKHLAARLTEMANDAVAAQAMSEPGAQPTPDPAPTPHPPHTRRIRVRHTPPTLRLPSPPMPDATPLHIKFERQAPSRQHA